MKPVSHGVQMSSLSWVVGTVSKKEMHVPGCCSAVLEGRA